MEYTSNYLTYWLPEIHLLTGETRATSYEMGCLLLRITLSSLSILTNKKIDIKYTLSLFFITINVLKSQAC